MSDFIKLTQRKLAAWERRAITIQIKAGALLDAMLAEIGPENLATDLADAVGERAEELTDLLARWRKSLSSDAGGGNG